jgi:hypothetical protein
MKIDQLHSLLDQETSEQLEKVGTDEYRQELKDFGKIFLYLSFVAIPVALLAAFVGGSSMLTGILSHGPALLDISNIRIGVGMAALGYFVLMFSVIGLPLLILFFVPGTIRGPARAKKDPEATAREVISWVAMPTSKNFSWKGTFLGSSRIDGWVCLLDATKRTFAGLDGFHEQDRRLCRLMSVNRNAVYGEKIINIKIDSLSDRAASFSARLSVRLRGPNQPCRTLIISGELGKVGKKWYVFGWQITDDSSGKTLLLAGIHESSSQA